MSVVPTPVRVAVVNDCPIVVAGLAHVMSQHPTRIRVLEAAEQPWIADDVDVVLCDAFAGDTDGDLGLPELVDRTAAKVVLFAADLSDAAITSAMAAGVAACVSKRATVEELVATIEAVHRREPVRSPTFDGSDVAGVGTWPGRAALLSSREAEVIAYIARGFTNEQIAASLFLSINSIKTYIRSAYRKIGVQRRTQAVLWAMDNGFASASARRNDDLPGSVPLSPTV